MTRCRLLLAVAAVLSLSALPVLASDLDDSGDFAQLFRLGGAERIDGGPYVLQEGTLFPVLPDLDTPGNTLEQNSYIWGLEWYHDPNLPDSSLYAGTNRNLFCLLGQFAIEGCPEPTEGALLPIPRHPEDAAQIWRYDPSATQGGIEGTWTQIWESPLVDNTTGCLLEFEIPEEGLGFAEIIALGACVFFNGPEGQYPASVGIRNLEECDAGGETHLYAAGLGLFGKIYYLNAAGDDFVEASSAGATFTEIFPLILDAVLGGTPAEEVGALFAELDLGYRGLSCWDPPGAAPPVLCTTPSGSILDPDGTAHPWVLCNADPTDTASPWEPYSPLGFDDPNVIGLFDMATLKVQEPVAPLIVDGVLRDFSGEVRDYLCTSDINRVEGGAVYCTNGDGCDVTTPDASGDFDTHACEWMRVASSGMQRPARFFGDGIGSGNGREENASAFGFGPYYDAGPVVATGPETAASYSGDDVHDYLYFGMADAAGGPTADNENAELFRVDLRGIVEDTECESCAAPVIGAPVDNPDFGRIHFLAGVPRVTVDGAGGASDTTVIPIADVLASGMVCVEEPILEDGTLNSDDPIPGGTMGCRSRSHLGVGLSPNEAADDNDGDAQYIWRFTMHQGDLFMGILNVDDGFNLYKTNGDSDGLEWDLVTDDGFGWGETNYGIRTMVSTDATPWFDPTASLPPPPTGPWTSAALFQPALFIGVANPYGGLGFTDDGGAQVYMGTTEPDFGPQAVVTGDVQAVGSPTATMDFEGDDSFVPFSSATIAFWEWFDEFQEATCAAPTDTAVATGDEYGPSLTSGFPFTDYPYSLKVTDSDTAIDCTDFTARAWANLPPTAEIWTVPPARPGVSSGGTRGRAYLVDWDGNGMEDFELNVKCSDPDSAIDLCFKDFDNVGSTYLFPDTSVLGTDVDEFTATVTMLQTTSTPNLDLIAVDEWADDFGPLDGSNPFLAQAGVDVQFIPFVDNALVNDAPACQSGLVVALVSTTLDYDPDDPAPGYPQLCDNPDGGGPSGTDPTELVYEVDSATGSENPDSGAGFLDGAATVAANGAEAPDLEYIADATPGLDMFVYEAEEATDTSIGSTEVPLFVRVIECTFTTPVVYEVVDMESPVSPTTREGCIGVIATDSEVTSPTTFTAGEWIEIGNGFSVDTGATLTLAIDPSKITG